MSTRCTTHFVHRLGDKPTAIVYRHSDGYPSEAGADIERFLHEVAETVQDTRFGDPSYLAAKYVVFLAREFSVDYAFTGGGKWAKTAKASRLDFLSVGILSEDPFDIEYRYTIVPAQGYGELPDVYVDALDGKGNRPLREVLAEAVK